MIRQIRKGFTLIELMIVVAIIGILAAIAIPNFMKFQSRSKQTEAKANLKALFTAQKAYYQEVDTYSTLVNQIGFTPERGNRYTYNLGGTVWQNRSTAVASSLNTETGISADTFKWGTTNGISAVQTAAFTASVVTGNTGMFYATAAGNIDSDTTLDQWSISDQSRPQSTTSATNTCAMDNNPGGEPCNDLNDV